MSYQPVHKYDALPSKPDHRDFLAAPVDAAALPDRVALPNVPVLDQGQEGSCTGHGSAGARETLDAVAQKPYVALSRAFLYYRARLLEHSTRTDSGAEVRDVCKVLNQTGVCTEQVFPYSDKVFARAPTRSEIASAAAYKIASYTRLTTTDQVRAALVAGNPVVIGIAVYESFEQKIGADGMVPMPDVRGGEQLLGGHCLYVRGYAPDPKQPGKFLFTVVNSWSDSWGDHGTCHMPEAYLNDKNLCSDLWSISL